MASSSQVLDRRVSAPPAAKDLSLIILLAVGALVVLRLWFLPLANSYWLDETFIVSLIRDTFAQTMRNTLATPQSPAFAALEWLIRHIRDSETVLRLPSLLAGVCGLLIYYRIGSEFINRETGLLFGGIYVSLGQIAQEVPNARPYSLALAFEAAGILWLLRWSRSGRWLHGIFWALCAAVAAYFHIVFAIAVPIEVVAILWWSWRQTRVPIRRIVACAAVTAVLLLPVLAESVSVSRDAKALSWAAKPTLLALAFSLFPIYALGGILLMLTLSYAEGSRAHWEKPSTDANVALLGSLLIGPVVIFFLIGVFTAVNPFADRYLLPTAPGLVLLGGWLISGIKSPFQRRMGLLVGMLLAAVLLGQPSSRFSLIPNYHDENWRDAARETRDAGLVLVYPGAVETRHQVWLRDQARWKYLIAPVLAYAPDLQFEKGLVLPFDFDQEQAAYMQQTIDQRLSGTRRIALVTRELFSGGLWDEWTYAHLTAKGFRKLATYECGRVTTSVFVNDLAAGEI